MPATPTTQQTTAYYRTEALRAEQELRWEDAARFWGKAMDAYPSLLRNGALYKRDMQQMLDRAKACVLAAKLNDGLDAIKEEMKP